MTREWQGRKLDGQCTFCWNFRAHDDGCPALQSDPRKSIHATTCPAFANLDALCSCHVIERAFAGAKKDGGPMTPPRAAQDEPRYELLNDDPVFGLSKGDILICEPMHWAWANEKIAVVQRESDGYDPSCSVYRNMVRHVSGPVL